MKESAMSLPGITVVELAGCQFACPADWAREVHETDEGWTVMLQSTGVSFGLVAVILEKLDGIDLMEQAVESLRDGHPGLEVEEIFDGEHEIWEVLFISLDMVSYAWITAREIEDHSVLIMVQSIEPESERGRTVFDAICRSLAPSSGPDRRID
jgi:hypothetical protein